MAGYNIRIALKSTQDIEDPLSPRKYATLQSGLDRSVDCPIL
jgi:hypothetical protein